MSNQKFPSWLGPLLGPIVGYVFAFKAMRREGLDDDQIFIWCLAGAGAGLLAGIILMIVDRPTSKSPPQFQQQEALPENSTSTNGLLGPILAVASVIFCFAPVLGMIVSVIAVALTRKKGGWPLIISIICLIAAVIITGNVIHSFIF